MPSKKECTLAGEETGEEHLVSGLSKKQKGMRERAGEEGGHATSGVGGGGGGSVPELEQPCHHPPHDKPATTLLLP